MMGIGTPSSHNRIERPIEFPFRVCQTDVVLTSAVAQAATFYNGRATQPTGNKRPASVRRLGKPLETIKFHARDPFAAYLEKRDDRFNDSSSARLP
jgi:hypothetical protein